MPDTVEAVFCDRAVKRIRQLAGRIEACLERLGEEHIWLRNSENANAIGNLCLHLEGNARQYILHGVAGAADVRVRDGEFSARGGMPKAELFARLNATLEEACEVIAKLSGPDLLRRTVVQGRDLTVLDAVFIVTGHIGEHAGQIIFATKALTGEEMGFTIPLPKPN